MCADYQTIHGSPLNRSISKQLYSFPKSNRFSPTPEPLCKGSYEIKRGAMGNRSTTFGYGNKINLADCQDVPPVGNYELKSEFLRNRDKSRGYRFTKQTKANVLVNPEKTSLIPGPGAYSHGKTLKTDRFRNLSYTIGSRCNDPFQKGQNPLGPGQYQTIPSISGSGNYFFSKYSSSGCGKIGRSKRTSLAKHSIVPGPGKYSAETKMDLNKTGVYFNSKFHNMEAGRFGKMNRPGLADRNSNPGPGSYGAFTEFAFVNKSTIRASTAGK